MPTRISKVHASWRLKQTFYKHYVRVASFDFGEIQTQKTIFFEVRSSLLLHHPVIENCLFQCAVQQPIKLMSWRIIFCANILQKEFNLLQMEKVDSCLHPSLDCERFLALRCSLTSRLVASLTSSGLEGILSNYMYLSVEEEGFPVWTSLLLFTVCQTPSVNFDMFNLGPTVTHIKIGPIVRRVPPIRNDHVYPCDSDRYQNELLCTNSQMEYTGTTGLDDVLASCNAG